MDEHQRDNYMHTSMIEYSEIKKNTGSVIWINSFITKTGMLFEFKMYYRTMDNNYFY